MKRFLALILVMAMVLSLCACESKEEKARREIQEANQAYQDAKDRLDDLKREQNRIQDMISMYD